MQRFVTFLDLLGFRSYATTDPASALLLLGGYQQILSTKLNDLRSYPPSSYGDPSVAQLASDHSLDSFEHFIPFSDSLFIVSPESEKFVRQLSHFLIDSFRLTAGAFTHPEEHGDPTKVTIKELPVGNSHEEHWYPALFRGGISFGEVKVGTVNGIIGGKAEGIYNLAGPVIVEAVGLEKMEKGPRVFCKGTTVQKCGSLQHLFAPVKEDTYELLWPAFQYFDNNHSDVELNKFYDLFAPAANLWGAFGAKPGVGEHYLEFMRLIVRSTLACFERRNHKEIAIKHIQQQAGQFNIDEALLGL